MAPRLPAASPRSLPPHHPKKREKKREEGASSSVSANDFRGAVRGMAGQGWVGMVGARVRRLHDLLS